MTGTEAAVGRKPIRAHLRDGVRAALSADPEVLTNCKPRTGLGLVVRGMIIEAGKGKMTALRMMMHFLDWKGEESEESQGIFAEPEWDWSPDGVWLTMPETDGEEGERASGMAAPKPASPAAPKPAAPAAKEERPMNREQRRRLAALVRQREKNEVRPGHMVMAAGSGNFVPAAAPA